MIKIGAQSQAFAAKFAYIAENWQQTRSHMFNFANTHDFFANPHVKKYHQCEKMLAHFLKTEKFVVFVLHVYKKIFPLHFEDISYGSSVLFFTLGGLLGPKILFIEIQL